LRRLLTEYEVAGQSFVFEKCRRAVCNSLGVPGELLALLEIALYVEPRSAVLEKLRGTIN
jgi:hypothetical protein